MIESAEGGGRGYDYRSTYDLSCVIWNSSVVKWQVCNWEVSFPAQVRYDLSNFKTILKKFSLVTFARFQHNLFYIS